MIQGIDDRDHRRGTAPDGSDDAECQETGGKLPRASSSSCVRRSASTSLGAMVPSASSNCVSTYSTGRYQTFGHVESRTEEIDHVTVVTQLGHPLNDHGLVLAALKTPGERQARDSRTTDENSHRGITVAVPIRHESELHGDFILDSHGPGPGSHRTLFQ